MLNRITNQLPWWIIFCFASSLPVSFHVAWRPQAITYVNGTSCLSYPFELAKFESHNIPLTFFITPYFLSMMGKIANVFNDIVYVFMFA